MAQENIPASARRFIAKHIDSVAELEGLLLLKAAPDEAWDVGKVAGRLYLREPEAGRNVARAFL